MTTKTKRAAKALLLFVLAVGMAGCQKEFDPPAPEPVAADPEIVEAAKSWFNRARSGSANGDLDFSSLTPDWKAFQISQNNAGQPVLTVPVANRSEEDQEYMELAYVDDGRGGVGVVKHYVGGLRGDAVGLKFYDARGRLFVQGRYDTETGLFRPEAQPVTKKSKLSKIASMSSSGNNTSEDPIWNPDSPIMIDEVVVYPPDNGCYYCGSWPPYGGGGGGSGGGGNDGGTGVPAPPSGGGGGGNGGGSGGTGGSSSASNHLAVSPVSPIVDLNARLNCLNSVATNSSTVYEITIHVHSAREGHPTYVFWSMDPGHAYITLQKTNGSDQQRLSFGFYPKEDSWVTPTKNAVASGIGEESDNGKRRSDIRLTRTLTYLEFTTAVMAASSDASRPYDLNDYNCTDYAISVFNASRINGDKLYVPDSFVGFTTPAGLYKKLNDLRIGGDTGVSNISTKPPVSTNCN